MSVRVEIVTPCEHDQWNPHRSGDGEIVASSDGAEIMAVICHGATRKAFTEWPPEAIEAAGEMMTQLHANGTLWHPDGPQRILAAALGHITEGEQ